LWGFEDAESGCGVLKMRTWAEWHLTHDQVRAHGYSRLSSRITPKMRRGKWASSQFPMFTGRSSIWHAIRLYLGCAHLNYKRL